MEWLSAGWCRACSTLQSCGVHGHHNPPHCKDASVLLPVRATDTEDTPVEEGSGVTGTRALLIVCQVDPDISTIDIQLNAVGLTSSAPAFGLQDGVMQARTSDRVTHDKCRWGETVFVFQDLFHHYKAPSVALHQLTGHHRSPGDPGSSRPDGPTKGKSLNWSEVASLCLARCSAFFVYSLWSNMTSSLERFVWSGATGLKAPRWSYNTDDFAVS